MRRLRFDVALGIVLFLAFRALLSPPLDAVTGAVLVGIAVASVFRAITSDFLDVLMSRAVEHFHDRR